MSAIGLVLCGMCLWLASCDPSPKTSQKTLANLLRCINRSPLAPGDVAGSEDGLITDEDRFCMKLFRSIPWQSQQCAFSPIKCLFRPGRIRIERTFPF
ncbi:hypothetical protein GCK32_003881 [Trichostrongylus colubriformis]|uniref:Secreted protein n=1 Tax=Trichostrongylus colubriformis TaxID=6319 RepID=A0AAN8FS72_TRICO